MWTLGYAMLDGSRATIAWFTLKDDALAALEAYNWRYSVEWDPNARIVAS